MNLPPIILASSSPRRSELLRTLGIEFTVIPSSAEEIHNEQLTATEIAELNAYRKARVVAKKHPDALVIGADTLVYLKMKVFGKPKNMEESYRMLKQLQGTTHQVATGVCLLQLRSHRQQIFAERTEVKFRHLSTKQIRDYMSLVNPLDKAGAYGIQEHGEMIVEGINGSLTNVIGLPLERLQNELAAWEKDSLVNA